MTDWPALSVLDLVPVREGGTLPEAYAATVELAQAAERLGYKRFWVAEHHAMDGVAGGAASVVLAHIGNATSTIRIGSGGIMLPNHTPFQIAEQFGTLDALFPGRIDLGLGRAPGAGPELQRALRKNLSQAAEHFPQDVLELRALITGRWTCRSGPRRDMAPMSSSGCWVRACSARSSPHDWACLMPLPRISRPITSTRRWNSTGAIFSPLNSLNARM